MSEINAPVCGSINSNGRYRCTLPPGHLGHHLSRSGTDQAPGTIYDQWSNEKHQPESEDAEIAAAREARNMVCGVACPSTPVGFDWYCTMAKGHVGDHRTPTRRWAQVVQSATTPTLTELVAAKLEKISSPTDLLHPSELLELADDVPAIAEACFRLLIETRPRLEEVREWYAKAGSELHALQARVTWLRAFLIEQARQ